jgi:ribonucleotide reductase alpha subunit
MPMSRKDIKELEKDIIGTDSYTEYDSVKNITTENYFNNNQFSIDAFKKKYALTVGETYVQALKRVCDFIASVEETEELKRYWSKRWFHEIYNGWWHPAGSIMQGAGSGKNVSLANCTTSSLGTGRDWEEWDSLEGIIKNTAYSVAKAAAYRQGTGIDFSRIRPEGADVLNSANKSTGVIHWMRFVDSIGNYIGQSGRKPALLISLNCKHPDIENFVSVKSDRSKIQNANLSVQCTDDFYKAVKSNSNWELKFEIPEVKKGQKVYVDVNSSDIDCQKDEKGWFYISKANRNHEVIKKTIKAKDLMELIAKNMHQNAEPGIQNIDIAKNYSNSDYLGDKYYEIWSTNACCLIGDSLVITDRGTMSIKEINDIFSKNPNENILAMSYNIKDKKYEFKRIVAAWQERNDATVELEIEEDGQIYRIECSADHPIMTRNRGYIQASSLTSEDDIVIFK